MIKVKIIAVGKIKEKYFQDAVLEYSKRLSRFCDLSIVEIKEENFVTTPNESERILIKEREGAKILKEIKGTAVALAIEGKKYSSENFAKLLEKIKDTSGEVCFIIGGSYGIADSVKQSAEYKLSASDMTFPHTLFRVMLLEQIYRGFMILQGSEYHK